MTISIPAGDLTRTVTIDPTADLIYEGNETVIATIASVSGGNGTTIGTPDSATVTITDEQSVPTVILTEQLLSLRTLQELLTYSYSSTATTEATLVSLEYTGTATNGTDYVASSVTISIPAGDLTRTVSIDPTADLIYEGNETVIATIASVSGGNGTTIELLILLQLP
jgi:outer membrane lipoprotein-sorting protein